MATDVVEAASPASQSASHYSQPRHFYLAVDRLHFKMETLVDLLGMAGRRPSLPMVVCCSARDDLDAVCSAVSKLSHISMASLYSDLAEAERGMIFEKFKQATMRWNQDATLQSGDGIETGKDEQKSHLIVVTDACLPLLASGETPMAARVLVNYELPMKKNGMLGTGKRQPKERMDRVAKEIRKWLHYDLSGNIYKTHGNLFGYRSLKCCECLQSGKSVKGLQLYSFHTLMDEVAFEAKPNKETNLTTRPCDFLVGMVRMDIIRFGMSYGAGQQLQLQVGEVLSHS